MEAKCPDCNHELSYHHTTGCVYHNGCECDNSPREVELLIKLTALETAADDVADIVQYYIMQNSRISNMLNTDELKAIAKLESLLGETK